MEEASVEIRSGAMDVIASGSVIGFNGNPIEIRFGSPMIRIIFKFEEIDSKDKQGIMAKNVDNSTLELTMNAKANNLGIWNTEPLFIGSFRNRDLYLNLRYYVQKRDVLLHYTFYIEDKEQKELSGDTSKKPEILGVGDKK